MRPSGPKKFGYWDPISQKIVDKDGDSIILQKFGSLGEAQAYASHYQNNLIVADFYRTPAEALALMDGLLAVA